MKKKIIAAICLVCLSVPVIASAGTTGWVNGYLNNHSIRAKLEGYNDTGIARTELVSCTGGNCTHGLYTYIEGISSNGALIRPGVEEWESNAYATGYISQYVPGAAYFNSRHSTVTNDSSKYLQIHNN
ncbi:hypothetical protein R0131_05075 [Clostridium sp. AL.422]|uniref:hypothetical protein n=1 Tax=Clostridium TaxID=1485 RepID=UPI00293DE458|nr:MULTISPECIES: hypothetical protein [unclassified Clostridium]MDV4150205.1 hypothetical protein [Clostridium sp. AL.422]